MKYRVHCVKVSKHDFQSELAQYINNLNGEVVSVVPMVYPVFSFSE
ncbi:MAG: hypothetical protein KBB71_13905 [Lentimicrobiaceae bacterium]|nr:hypothetical protein [Lentimicrobiaceae bacterium]